MTGTCSSGEEPRLSCTGVSLMSDTCAFEFLLGRRPSWARWPSSGPILLHLPSGTVHHPCNLPPLPGPSQEPQNTFLLPKVMIWGTWPGLRKPILHLFPGITQNQVIFLYHDLDLGAQPTAQTIPRLLKVTSPLCRKVRLSQMCLLLHLHRGLGTLIQMVMGQGEMALEICT